MFVFTSDAGFDNIFQPKLGYCWCENDFVRKQSRQNVTFGAKQKMFWKPHKLLGVLWVWCSASGVWVLHSWHLWNNVISETHEPSVSAMWFPSEGIQYMTQALRPVQARNSWHTQCEPATGMLDVTLPGWAQPDFHLDVPCDAWSGGHNLTWRRTRRTAHPVYGPASVPPGHRSPRVFCNNDQTWPRDTRPQRSRGRKQCARVTKAAWPQHRTQGHCAWHTQCEADLTCAGAQRAVYPVWTSSDLRDTAGDAPTVNQACLVAHQVWACRRGLDGFGW